MNKIKYHLLHFRHIRPNLTTNSAIMSLNSVILPHLTYAITSGTLTNKTTLKSAETIYNKALKILDKKPCSYHCRILDKYKFLNWDMIKHADLILVYKILNELAPPSLKEFVKRNSKSDNKSRF